MTIVINGDMINASRYRGKTQSDLTPSQKTARASAAPDGVGIAPCKIKNRQRTRTYSEPMNPPTLPPPPQPTGGNPPPRPAPAPQPRSPQPTVQTLTDADVERIARQMVASIPAAQPATNPTPGPFFPPVVKQILGWIVGIASILIVLFLAIGFISLAWPSWSKPAEVAVIPARQQVVAPSVIAQPIQQQVAPVIEAQPVVQAVPVIETPMVPQGERRVVFNQPPRDFVVGRTNNRTGERVVLGTNVSPEEAKRIQDQAKKWHWNEKGNYFDPQGRQMPGPNR